MMNEQLDRMVDGELTENEQRAVLLGCEEQDRWRELALAYVEAQVLSRELPTIQELEMDEPPREVRPVPTSAASWLWNPFALAAAVVLSLSIGYGAGWWWQGPVAPVATIASQEPMVTAGAPTSSSPRLMQLTVSHPTTNELRQIELPIVNASQLGPNWREQIQTTFPDESTDFLRQMRDAGLNIQQTRTVTPITLSDGTRVLVPIDYYFETPFQ